MADGSTHPHPGVARMLSAKLVNGKTQRERVLDELEDGEATRAELSAVLSIPRKSADNTVGMLIDEGLVEPVPCTRPQLLRLARTKRTS